MSFLNQSYLDAEQTCLLITLQRPEALNALNRALLAELKDMLQNLSSPKVLIIRGSGERAFSAGADLKERAQMSLDDTRAFLKLINQVFNLIENLPMPTVAHINGLALGGGLELALACDMRVMAPHAQVGLTECALGIIPGAGGTGRLPKIIGYAKACEIIFSAQKINAQKALQIGLVNQIAESPEEFAFNIAKNPSTSLNAAKQAMKTGKESECYEQVINSPERLAALKAFTESH